MSEVNIKKKRKRLSTSALVLIVACLIIAIPCVTFGGILLSATLQTGTPVLGERFKNDLDPEINKGQQDQIISNIKALDGVEDCEIVLKSAQFRVNIDANDSISVDQVKTLADSAYEKINSTLAVGTYFTMSSNGQKMYDLSINVYNYIPSSKDDENWISYLVTKNSNMETKQEQMISSPLSPELAKQLRGETTSTDVTESNETTETSE